MTAPVERKIAEWTQAESIRNWLIFAMPTLELFASRRRALVPGSIEHTIATNVESYLRDAITNVTTLLPEVK